MNKVTISCLILGMAVLGNSCMQKEKENIIGKTTIEQTSDDNFSAERLWSMGRIGNVNVRSTGKRDKAIVYSVAYYSVKQNKSNNELFAMRLDGSKNQQLTCDNFHQTDGAWLQDGRIAYLSNESGSSQIWAMNDKGKKKTQISFEADDVEGFQFSPDGKKVLFIKQVKTVATTQDKYPDLDKASGRIITDLMYKHWDEWTTSAPHPFVADFDGKTLSNVRDLLQDEPYECPMKPFGGMEQLAWSPDSKLIAYTCRKKTGLQYALSTNSDIYLYDLETGKTRNLTETMMGYDTNPQFSPDGTQLAWQSMARDGYESDQNRLFVLDFRTDQKRFVSQAFESNVDQFIWLNDSSLAFAGVWHALEHLYKVNLQGQLEELTTGQFDYSICGKAGETLICKRHSMQEADEIFALNLETKALTQLSFENKELYDQVTMGAVQERWQKTTDGKDMLTWIIYPPHFDPNKKYPTLLYCEGGPQSPVSQFWSYRWNFMMMAAHGYIVVAPNRRGLPGFGNEWNEAISGDYGGQCMKDYFTAIDEFCTEPYVDTDHLGCVGASFGGFSVYWIAGHHDHRFKAFIAHDGIFNMEMQYLETEEKWFANWDMGGAYWEKDNAVAQRTFANSPHRFVDKWDTPILCIHGEKDYRILASQAMAAFDAAKMRGIEAELLLFPDENHWVLKPQNGILWQRTFFEWLDKWLKPNTNETYLQ